MQRGRDRLSAVDQGIGRRRRQRHARGAFAAGVRQCAGGGAARVESGVRRRRGAAGKVSVGAETHRGADPGGFARPHAVSVRARLLRAAPASEGHRRSAGADVDACPTDRVWGRPRSKPPRRSATKAPARSSSSPKGTQLLFHGNEYAPAGGAPGHRSDPRSRSRRVAVAHRRG